MSVEAEVTEGLQAPVDQNAQATEDAKKLLAELEADGVTSVDQSANPEANGTANGGIDHTSQEQAPDDAEEARDHSAKRADRESEKDKRRERRHSGDRRDRGGNRPARGSRGGRGGGSFGRRDNIRSVLTDQEKSSDPTAIRKQVEFYFSDSNLPMDKFLLEKVGGSKNNPVDLSIIHSFKRMRRFEPFEAIVEALKESEVLQLTDDDTKVQRRIPLPDNIQDRVDYDAVQVYEDKSMPRSVYVKGFGDEKPSTQFDIEAFFAEHGPTNAIRLRRSDDKNFKGSVFAEFETEEHAKKFLELDPKPQFQGRDLQIMSKKEYCDKKVEDIKSGKIKPNSRQFDKSNRGGSRGSFREKRGRDDKDDRDWRTRREHDRKNGFRDDKRRGNRDRRSDNRDHRGGDHENEAEKDERGIPKVKASASTDDREAQKQEALSKAKAVVEAEESKKRDREEEAPEESAAQEPPAKKIDVKEA